MKITLKTELDGVRTRLLGLARSVAAGRLISGPDEIRTLLEMIGEDQVELSETERNVLGDVACESR